MVDHGTLLVKGSLKQQLYGRCYVRSSTKRVDDPVRDNLPMVWYRIMHFFTSIPIFNVPSPFLVI